MAETDIRIFLKQLLTDEQFILLESVETPYHKGYDIGQKLLLLTVRKDIRAYDILFQVTDLINPQTLHFICNNLQDALYRKRDEDPIYIERAKQVCILDMTLAERIPDIYTRATLPCVNRLINILDKEGDLQKAIEVCQLAVKYRLVGSYENKLRILTSRLVQPDTPKPKRIKETYNENGLCEKEVIFINAINNELKKRNLKATFDYFIKSTGIMALRFSNINLGNIKLRNISDATFQDALRNIPEYVNSVEKMEHFFKKWKK